MNDNNLVTVKTFSNRMDAEVAGSRLRAEGIEFQILADDAGGAYPFPLQPKFGVLLRVSKKNLNKARKALGSD